MAAKRKPSTTFSEPPIDIILAAYMPLLDPLVTAIEQGSSPDTTGPLGLSPLHIAVGLGNIRMARFLVEQTGAKFFPDDLGRMPSSVAVDCRVSDEMLDYICAAEAKFLGLE